MRSVQAILLLTRDTIALVTRRRFWWCWNGLIALTVLTCLYTLFALQYRFGGYDLSPLIDSGWRVLNGQVPNRDFICTFPPILYLSVAAAYKLLGVRWLAITFVSVVVPIAVEAMGMRVLLLLRKRMGEGPVLTLGAAYSVALLLPVLMVGHLWHSSWTEMFALLALAATYALLQLRGTATRREQMELVAHLCLAETGLLLAKPNGALPALLFCTVSLLLTRAWWNGIAALLSALLVSSVALAFAHTSLLATARLYGQLSARFLPQGYFNGLFVNSNVTEGLRSLVVYIPILPLLAWVLIVVLARTVHRQAGAVDLLALGACVISVVALGTNVEFGIVDTPCLLFGTAMLGATGAGRAFRLKGVYFFALYSLLLLGIFYSATRARMQAVGEWGSDDCGLPLADHEDKFFGSFHNCPAFFSLLAETDATLAAHPGARVFFGPRMEFLYARERQQSPRGMPLWWHPGTSFAEADLAAILEAWQKKPPDLLIFLQGDRTRMPPALLARIGREYTQEPAPLTPIGPGTVVPVQGRIDVLVRALQ